MAGEFGALQRKVRAHQPSDIEKERAADKGADDGDKRWREEQAADVEKGEVVADVRGDDGALEAADGEEEEEEELFGGSGEFKSLMHRQVSPRRQASGEKEPQHAGEHRHPPDAAAQPKATVVVCLVCCHAISASLLLVVNRWALKAFPYVWFLTTLQFVPTALIVGCLSLAGLLRVDPLEARMLWKFFPGAGMLFITLAAGNAVVKHTNVDTFIVMRSLLPIPCALLESCLLGEPHPRPASWLGLGILLLGAILFAIANRGIAVAGASWGALFLIMMPLSGVFMKRLIITGGLSTTWGLVLYQNTLAGAFGILATAAIELSSLAALHDFYERLAYGGSAVWVPLLLSAASGVSVSFFQMSVRRVVSSTAFMVLGVSNKLLAVFANQLATEANSSLMSVSGVVTSIAGAVVFQQTVKGGGLSQARGDAKGGSEGARPTTRTFGTRAAVAAMTLGVGWAALLTAIDAGVRIPPLAALHDL